MATNTLQDWFETPLGQYLLDKERAYLDDVTPDIFGFHALQLGLPRFDLLRESRIAHRLRVASSDHPDLRAKCHELPIATQSIDLVLLPHVLEFAEHPHAILREVDRVMMPEGRLVILGFNPWSLWGLRSSVGPARGEFPWNGHFVSLLRVKDWLALLGFDVSAGRLAGYAPPIDGERMRRRFGFMEPAGDRWWAVGGAVYMLQAIKRVRGMRLITPAWQEKSAREKALIAAAKRQGAGPSRADDVIAASKPAAHLRIVK
ncbi:MAG TPA: methyltransferase domain-containing protein [Usitatibacter sp.]|jgi:SAM-dependent methyltransferase|nr:methyltransferase domain-containing protein [Usitatibacter sp.]